MATYPLLIERAGFIFASSLVFFGVSYAFGAKNAPKNLLISLIFSFIVYFSFTRGLNVNLPSRLIENTLGSGLDFVGRALGDVLSALKGVFGNE
jgi:putative tricarboxylic transport membrane protein